MKNFCVFVCVHFLSKLFRMKEYSKDELERMRIAMNGETQLDKMKRKCREEPFVPAGKAHTTLLLFTH